MALAFAVLGCSPAMLSAVTKAAQVTQWIGSLLDVADGGQRLYFNRHPNMEAEQRVAEALRVARAAVAAADRAVAAAESAEDGNMVHASEQELKAYGELRALLQELGVLDGIAAPGGAESDAPAPGKLDLPTVAEIAQHI